MRELGKYQDVLPVVSSSGGFYNPDQETNKRGEFYLSISGVPKSLEISYIGNIVVIKNPNLSEKISLAHNKQEKKIFFNSKSTVEYTEEKIFTFTGEIKQLNYVRIHNWADKIITSSIVNYDQTHPPLNKSETNFEDDSIIIRDIAKKKRRTFRFVKKRGAIVRGRTSITPEERERLPESYTNRSKEKPQYCKNCYFLEGINHCHKWDATVSQSGWCASWKKKEGVR